MVSAHFTSLNIEYIFLIIYKTAIGINENDVFRALFMHAWFIISIIGYTLSIIALLILIYSSIKLAEVRSNDNSIFGPLATSDNTEEKKNIRWQHVRDLISSTNINDWRQAIIESDIILGELLTNRGYKGENMAEQLKQATVADFVTLNDAWDVHKVRNRIAHDGSTFDFSDVFARRTIDKYENIFHEFNVI